MTTFLLNREPISLTDTDPDMTVLEYLRQDAGLTGTKEGCASGDCGACTVVVGENTPDGLRYRSLNSCITFVHSLNGKQVLTVEHLVRNGELHPVQDALVRHHGSQCGFCTPGFVMSLFALYHSEAPPQREAVLSALSGNLCRCTGYRPIIDAALEVLQQRHGDAFDLEREAIEAELGQMETSVLPNTPKADPSVGFWQPRTRQELAKTLESAPDARFSAGSTDLALEKTQSSRSLHGLIDLTRVEGLNSVIVDDTGIHIGAAVSYSDLEPALLADYPEAAEWLERLGSRPIRNRGTLGGNLGTASPIGDTPPLLIALGAEVTLASGHGERRIPVAELITGYRRTQLQAGEWIDTVHLPRRRPGSELRAYKISKRFEDDISTVCAVFYLEPDDERVAEIRAAFGGLAATPLWLPDWQASLVGQHWPSLDIEEAARRLADELAPIDDVRASARYRVRVTANLLKRFHLETTRTDQLSRVFNSGVAHHA
ncbi:xanthine dehydrogenase small subunit [Saccharospirillum salsuginis]|uniref:Xanthine dehydrogenase n=1 Tax=Saccharospirillum salsuginis TaxID=418750 RepID=A0A918K3D9_9GAMM|nr:xanthine dehydrogenase small subunit [Saccharospirillum salsuginis]GGX46006.1 xanthine dehydrogenase [Saccharospirillum salsuginis]